MKKSKSKVVKVRTIIHIGDSDDDEKGDAKVERVKATVANMPLRNLGLIASSMAMPVVGCAEGIDLYPTISDVGLMVTAYDDAFADSYAECKRRKTEAGYLCMGPVFPKVSVLRDYQYWTAALADYIKQCLDQPLRGGTPRYLVIQRCRGSEVGHTFDVWSSLLSAGDFSRLFDKQEHGKVFYDYKNNSQDNDDDIYGDGGLTLFSWHVRREVIGIVEDVCTIFFRKGWEPDRICQLPRSCEENPQNTTVFLFGTCCRFRNCDEGDVLLPVRSMHYDVKKRVLESPYGDNVNYFEQNKRRIWSPNNMSDAAKVILYALATKAIKVCSGRKTFEPVYAWHALTPAIQIQVSDIFEAPKGDALEKATFTIST